jgi:hypothetical protein
VLESTCSEEDPGIGVLWTLGVAAVVPCKGEVDNSADMLRAFSRGMENVLVVGSDVLGLPL